jgi:hypothetical protein
MFRKIYFTWKRKTERRKKAAVGPRTWNVSNESVIARSPNRSLGSLRRVQRNTYVREPYAFHYSMTRDG